MVLDPIPNLSPYIFLGLDPSPPPRVWRFSCFTYTYVLYAFGIRVCATFIWESCMWNKWKQMYCVHVCTMFIWESCMWHIWVTYKYVLYSCGNRVCDTSELRTSMCYIHMGIVYVTHLNSINECTATHCNIMQHTATHCSTLHIWIL